jgi:Asp-tRNA(Asn)/Glu-tRNA(Gln) amidotransferase A subunit family amidase
VPDESSPIERLRAALAGGEISPRALAEEALSRANSNAGHNVFLSLDAEWTLREAEDLPARFPGEYKPALYGLPISLKDCFDLQGFPTTCGSKFYAHRNGLAREDSAVAARLRGLGAVIVGKTHMHPLAYGITGENPEYGDSLQPPDASRLTGGSSSGAAASLQEGSAVAGIGTDTGGSIRVPAGLCGLAGYRASIELAHECGLWRGAMHLAPSFDTLGWLFSDLRDAAILATALFDLHPAPAPKQPVHVACVAPEFLHDCDTAVLAGFDYWKDRLQEHGAEIHTIDTAFWEDAMAIYAPIQAFEAAAIHRAATGGDFSCFEPSIAERLAWGATIPLSEITRVRKLHEAFRDRMDRLLSEHEHLIAPCAPTASLAAAADHSNTRRAILRYTTPVSLAGVPVVTLPAGVGAAGSGAGVQLVAARGADARLVSFAANLRTPMES